MGNPLLTRALLSGVRPICLSSGVSLLVSLIYIVSSPSNNLSFWDKMVSNNGTLSSVKDHN